ncbi:hypothetical protein HK101_010150, partial [Irineochytrium annulatum]
NSIELASMVNLTETYFTPQTGIVVNYQFTSTLVSTDYVCALLFGHARACALELMAHTQKKFRRSVVEAYLTTHDPLFDIFMIDVVWPGDLAENLLDLSPSLTPEDQALHNPQIWDSDVVNGRHVALPYFADYGVFYYRTDLLAKYNYSGPPETWDEMEAMALTILAGEGHPANLAGYLAQFDNAGAVVEMDGTVSINNDNTSHILQRVQRWFTEGITPKPTACTPGSKVRVGCLFVPLKADYEHILVGTGEAIFMRQWPYLINVMEASNVTFTWDVAPLPGVTKESRGAAVLGGWHLAPNQATRNASATAAVIKFMSSALFQKQRYLVTGVLPTIPGLFQDAQICAKVRHCDLFSKLLVNPRPSAQTSPSYLAVSQVLYTAVNHFLSQHSTIEATLSDAQINTMKAMGTYGTYVISRSTFVSAFSPPGMALIIVSAFGIVCSLGSILLVRINLEQRIIKASSPDFLLCIIFGIMLGFSTTFVYIGNPTRLTCILQPWLLCLSFCLTNSALLSKTYRIYSIFGNKKRLSASSISGLSIFRNMAILCGIEVAVLIVWTIIDPPVPTGAFQSTDAAFWTCSSAKYGTIFSGILLGMSGLMLVAGTWLAYQTRNVDEKFRESFYLACTMYNSFIWSIIAISLVFLDHLGGTVQFVIRSLAICMVSFGALLLIFAPKFSSIYLPEREIFHLPSTGLYGRSMTGKKQATPNRRSNNSSDTINNNAHVSVRIPNGGEVDRRCFGGYCLNIAEGRTQVIRSRAGTQQGAEGDDEFVILLRMPDRRFYEFQFEEKGDMDEFIGDRVRDAAEDGVVLGMRGKRNSTPGTLALAAACLGAVAAAASPTTVNVMLLPVLTSDQGRDNTELDSMVNVTETYFTSKTGIVVNYEYTSTLVTTEYVSVVEAYLITHDPSFDIFMIDVVWPGDLATNLLDLSPYLTPEDQALHNPQIWDSDIVNGRHVAMPYLADYGIFYYRTDLLAKYNYSGPPETWDEMEAMALTILAGEGHPTKLAGYLAQFDLYEGLTCNLMEWLRSADAGAVVEGDGTVSFNNANTSQMLQRVQRWFNDGIIPKYALTYEETDCMHAWIKGEAIFMRQWPYVISVMETSNVTFTWDVAPLPGVTKESRGASVLGGWHLAPNQATRNASATAEVIKFMTSALFQKQRCLVTGVLPTIPSLFKDPEICAKIRHCDLFSKLLVIPRPSAQTSPHYLAVSQVLYTAVNHFLSQQITIDSTLTSVQVSTLKAMGTYGTYVLSLATYVSAFSPPGMALMVVSALGVVCSLASIVIIIVGIMLSFSTTVVYIGNPTRLTCILQPWLLCLSFCLTNSALLSKTYRIYSIFGNMKKMSASSVSGLAIIRNMAILCGIEVVVLIIWTVLDPPVPAGVFQSADAAFLTCSSAKYGDIFSGILLSMNGLMLVAGTWLAYQTRNVDEKYRESFYLACTMYNSFIWSIIAISLVFLTQLGGTVQFVIRSLAICMVSFGALILLFAPKFSTIYLPQREVLRLPSMSSPGKDMTGRKALAASRRTNNTNHTNNNSEKPASFVTAGGWAMPIYCRSGRTSMFLGRWMTGRCFVREEGGSRCLIIINSGVEEDKSCCRGHCITLAEGRTQMIRSTSGTQAAEGDDEFVILLRMPDEQFYEFQFEEKEDMDDFVVNVVSVRSE